MPDQTTSCDASSEPIARKPAPAMHESRNSRPHPLGPLVTRRGARRPGPARAVAFVVAVGAVGALSLAAWLAPDPSGLGTHRQLGYPPCTSIVLFGYPCPTCGMTTAFAHAVRGEWLLAFHAQPAGLAAALTAALAAVGAIVVLATGQVWKVNWYRVSPARVALAVVLLILSGWAYKLIVGLAAGTLPVP